MANIQFKTLPNFQNMQIVNPDTGYLTPTWGLLMSQFMQTLQNNMSPQGVIMPPQSTANISTIQNNSAVGTIIYNSDTNAFVGNVNGIYKTFQMT